MKADLTAAYVRSILDYDPETGAFTWRERPREHFKNAQAYSAWNTRWPRTVAGSAIAAGYIHIRINMSFYRAHRLAWLWMTGQWPVAEIDHINRSVSDNHWSNLREATSSQNSANQTTRKDNTSGVKGVYWNSRRNKWHARVHANGTCFHLGYFGDIDSAEAAYKTFATTLHGEFARMS